MFEHSYPLYPIFCICKELCWIGTLPQAEPQFLQYVLPIIYLVK